VCSACRVAERKAKIDWAEREAQLRALCDRYRRNDGGYDCVVPGSGGKDSFFAAHKLKYVYGMNPLTVTWAPHIYTPWGWNNFQAWIHAGFDNYLFTPNGRVHRLLTRLALEQMFHPFQPFIMGQMYFPPRLAAQLGIPLVFYGENPTEYGNDARGEEKPTKDWEYFCNVDRSEMYIAGTAVADLKQHFGLGDHDLAPYLPPDAELLRSAGIEIHYLGYYLPWHPQECYYYAVEHGGFQAAPERTPGTYSKYSSIDDKIDDLHYYTTYIKFGIGRATYDSSQEIRNGEIDREEAVRLVQRFDGEYPTRFEAENFAYLSIPEREFPVASRMFEQPIMDREYFARLTDRFRSPHLWQFAGNNWSLRRTVFDGVDP
jgi:N-acetyl sugar amidotransferase